MALFGVNTRSNEILPSTQKIEAPFVQRNVSRNQS